MPRRSELQQILKTLERRGVRYADIRVGETREEVVAVRNGRVESVASTLAHSAGVRVLVGNGWGFAGSTDDSTESLVRLADRAWEIAAATHIAAREAVILDETEPYVDFWRSRFEIDPFSVPIDRKIDHLLSATEALRVDDSIHEWAGEISSYHQKKTFASTLGSFIEQTTTEMGAGIDAIAIGDDEMQRRSYPNSSGGDYQARGWEFVESLDLLAHAPRVGREAAALLKAPKAPAGAFDLIIGSSQLALQVHESCGHPAELDRALGWEISLAGGSFLQPSMLGKFRYGAPIVNIVGDATVPHAIGSFGYDDEGTRARRFHIIEDGIFVNYLTSRETAPTVGKRSNGTVRGEEPSSVPIIRMTNINLEPGTIPLAGMIDDTRYGILVETNKSWSIDDLRLNFQFGCEAAWEIVNGKVGRLLKNPIYTGSTPVFWNSCDAISNAASWRIWGLPNCGKGDPMQTMRVAHGAPYARFRDVEMF